MTERFRYEALGPLRKAALTITSPLTWRDKAGPWILDNQTGVRVQLSGDEEAVLSRLASHPNVAFEDAAQAIMDKRRGYVAHWHKISRHIAR